MDYVRKVLLFLRKYHFWVLGAGVVVILGVFWTTASARLSEKFQQRKSDVERDFSDMHQVAGMPEPVNEVVYNMIQNIHEQLQKNVMRGWRHLYEEQRKNNPLPAVLGERFIKEWNQRGPNEELPPEMREHYWNFIKNYFPELLKKADIRRPKNPELLGRTGTGPAGLAEGILSSPTGTQNIEYEGIVVWDEANYKQLLARFQWTRLPTTQQIRLAQEDLWVYETLLAIIKELNKDATSHYNAVVKRIFALDIGQSATKAFYEARDVLGLRTLSLAGAAGAGGEMAPGAMPGLEGGMPAAVPPEAVPGAMGPGMPPGVQEPGIPPEMTPGMLEGPGMTGPAPAGTTTTLERLYQFRYVDQNEQPVPLENGLPKHPFSEFKMMPIRMRLLMDQRKIPELLVLCANSKMPIEVRQVRLNPGWAAKVNYAAAKTAPPAAMPGMGPGMEMPGPIAPGGEGVFGPPTPGQIGEGLSPAAGPLGSEIAYQGPYDVTVEVLGIIYIYEPPDEKKLGTGAALSGEAAPVPAQPPEGEKPAAPAETAPGAPPGPAGPSAGPAGGGLPAPAGTSAGAAPPGSLPPTAPTETPPSETNVPAGMPGPGKGPAPQTDLLPGPPTPGGTPAPKP